MNTIEHSHNIMGTKPATKIELQESIIRVRFHNNGSGYIQKLASSMLDRCKAVIAASGGSTKY